MSDHRLPEFIDPLRLAESGRELHGILELKRMHRLASYLQDTEGEVEVDLRFGVDEEGVRYVRGRLKTTVSLVCQRCLGELRQPLDAGVNLGIVTSEAFAQRLGEQYEPVVVGTEPLSLAELVEDELILSLPIVPRHHDERCAGNDESDGEDKGEARRENPFAGLAVLKTNRKS